MGYQKAAGKDSVMGSLMAKAAGKDSVMGYQKATERDILMDLKEQIRIYR